MSGPAPSPKYRQTSHLLRRGTSLDSWLCVLCAARPPGPLLAGAGAGGIRDRRTGVCCVLELLDDSCDYGLSIIFAAGRM